MDVVVVSLRRFAAPDAAAVRQQALTMVNGRRTTTGLRPLVGSQALDAVAQQLADDALAGRVAWDALVQAAGHVLVQREVPVGAFGAGGLTQGAFEPGALLADPGLLDKSMGALGVGVAAGPLPGQAAPQVLIVHVVADKVPPK